jgi:hypothetical protein
MARNETLAKSVSQRYILALSIMNKGADNRGGDNQMQDKRN